MTGLLDRYAARKRRREEEAEREAKGVGGSVRPPMDEGLDIQTIVIPASPEWGLTINRARKTLPVKSQGRKLQFLLLCKWFIHPNGWKAARVPLGLR